MQQTILDLTAKAGECQKTLSRCDSNVQRCQSEVKNTEEMIQAEKRSSTDLDWKLRDAKKAVERENAVSVGCEITLADLLEERDRLLMMN